MFRLATVGLTLIIISFIYLSFAFCRLEIIKNHLPTSPWKSGLIGAGIVLAIFAALYFSMDFFNAYVCIVYLFIFWLMADGIEKIIKLAFKLSDEHYYAGVCAIVFTIIYFGIGWYNAHHVVETKYALTTDKNIGVDNLRVIAMADSHVGATFHWQQFEEYAKEISAKNPDIVAFVGDFTDDDTTKEDMEQCSRILGQIQAKYGVFYVHGNHDAGYHAAGKRNYTIDDINRSLETNGVKILSDQIVNIAGNVNVCGRLDKWRYPNRKSADSIMKNANLSNDAYVITLDHSPTDYNAEAESGMDLVISGHTHGGQLWGLGPIGKWFGGNDSYYGLERRKNTDFIVTSGIGNWRIKFKTGCVAEYIVIDIKKRGPEADN